VPIQYAIRMQSYPTDYVYVHVHPQRPNEVVYVGRGSGSRAWSIGGRKTQDHRVWLREWAALGYSPDKWVRIVSPGRGGLTPAQAVKMEKELIAFHVNRGDRLFNVQGNKKELIRRHRNKFYPEGPQRDSKRRWG
jgi:hypothetical protein